MSYAPEQFTRGGLSNSPDPITYATDESYPMRRETPPFMQDGSVPNVAITVTDSPNPLPVQTGTVPHIA